MHYQTYELPLLREFRKHRNFILSELPTYDSRDDKYFYVEAIRSTFAHLERIIHIKEGMLSWERNQALYGSRTLNWVQRRNVSLDSLFNLEYDFFEKGKWYEANSLNSWLKFHNNFVKQEGYLKTIPNSLAPDSPAHYHEEIQETLKHLYNVIYIQNHHQKRSLLCHLEGPYEQQVVCSYDLSALKNLKSLRVDYLDKVKGAYIRKSRRSIQESIDVFNRNTWYEEISAHIDKRLREFGQDDLYKHKQALYTGLERLGHIIHIVNIDVAAGKILAQGTAESPFYYSEVMKYNLKTKEDMVELEIHTYDKEKKIKNDSLASLLYKMKAPRIAKSLFKSIYQEVMAEIYRLQELAETITETASQTHTRAYTKKLADALNRLYLAINSKYNQSHFITLLNSKNYNFSDVSHMLALEIEDNGQINPSLDAIIQEGEDTYVPHLKEKLLKITSSNALQQVKMEHPVVMPDGMLTSIVIAKRICALAENNDLDQIKLLNPSAQEINLLIGLPFEILRSASISQFWNKLTFNNIAKEFNTLCHVVQHNHIQAFLGHYNALIIAVCYRHFEVVEYFINTKKANPDIKGGRNKNFSARDCAELEVPILKIKPPDPRITALFRYSLQSGPIRGSYSNLSDENDEGYEHVSRDDCTPR